MVKDVEIIRISALPTLAAPVADFAPATRLRKRFLLHLEEKKEEEEEKEEKEEEEEEDHEEEVYLICNTTKHP